MSKITEYKKIVDGKEITFTMYGSLVCPNPTEFYRMTRSYDQMRQEYEMSEAGMKELDDRLFWKQVRKAQQTQARIDLKYSLEYMPFVVLAVGLLCIISMWVR